MTNKPIKALGMLSGGLDSTLAAKVLLDLGIEVEGINFSTGFCVTEHTRNFKDETKTPIRANEALRLGVDLNFKVSIVDISKNYLPVVTDPKYGYGSNMNPCIDCRVFMLRRMRELMDEKGAQFVFTGEVLGQRPMSQHRQAMRTIERESGLEGLILRPLSAQLLEPTTPEKLGWVDREKLLALTGRSRKPQIELAQKLGLEDYPQPAGGCCFLADPQYSKRLKDFFAYNDKHDLGHETVLLLKVGRHLRISEKLKVIIGRNEKENNFLRAYEKGRHAFEVLTHPAANMLCEVKGELTLDETGLLASIAARYSDTAPDALVAVQHRYAGVEVGSLEVRRAEEEYLSKVRV